MQHVAIPPDDIAVSHKEEAARIMKDYMANKLDGGENSKQEIQLSAAHWSDLLD